MSKRLAKRVLVIGWDAADWKVINPLMDAGHMPALEKLVNRGAMGKIATLDPPLSPILWSSIGTGKTADKHGILNFIEPDPNTGDVRPVSVTSRKVKAIWNILSQQGMKTHLVGWWPSHPAEPINGVCVSNMYQKLPKEKKGDWKMPPNAVYPPALENVLKDLRMEPSEITASMLLPFVPNAHLVDQEKDKSLQGIAGGLAELVSTHSAATWIMENHADWDFMGVYYDSIDHFCHGFMKYHPPRQEGIPEEFFNLYKDVINSIYKFHDMMLERLLQLAGEDTTVILLSDHGFHSDHLRPKKLPKEPIAPALEHSPYGVLAMAGPGIVKDERIFGATLLDITPTILALYGLPIGKDMDGKPLLQAFSETVKPDLIDSWEQVAGDSGMHPPDVQQDPWAAKEAMDQLIELGYVEAPGKDTESRIKSTRDETDFNLAKVYASTKRPLLAIPILERLFEENPDAARFGIKLAHCYQMVRNVKELRRVIDVLKSKKLDNMPHIDYLDGILLLQENKPRKAMASLREAEKKVGHLADLHVQIGNVYNKLRKWKDAELAFQSAISIDLNNAQAYHGLCISLLRQYEYEAAAEAALNAVSLMHYFPEAHYHLGEALFHLKDYERAAQAFTVAKSMNPGMKKAHLWLIRIYEEHLNRPDLAQESRRFVQQQIRGTVTLVTGLPHSGASLVMKLINAGGMEQFSDNSRLEDTNNPNGYLEYEKVKTIAADTSWIAESDGKAVNVIAPLLRFLPENCHYKIVFVERDLNEILAEQQLFAGKNAQVYPAGLANTYSRQLEMTKSWISGQPNMEVLYLPYSELLQSGTEQLENLHAFMNLEGEITEMEKALNEELSVKKLK